MSASKPPTGPTSRTDIRRPFMVKDEIARLSPENELQFGTILEEYPAYKTFLVDWRTPQGDHIQLENGFNPSNSETVKLVDRQHSEGQRVVNMIDRLEGEVIQSITLATIFLPYRHCFIENVLLDKMTPWSLPTRELIVLDGWIGRVSSLEWDCLLIYDDGYHCQMQLSQKTQSNTSFGYEKFTKLIFPHAGQRIKPTGKEYDTAVWLGISIVDSLKNLFFTHNDQEATVVISNMSKIYVKWLCPLNHHAKEPKPPRIIDGKKIAATTDCDIKHKTWAKKHTLCHYDISPNDQVQDINMLQELFITEFLQSKVDSKIKKVKLGDVSSAKTVTIPNPGERVLAETIRLRHFYIVQYDDGCGEKMLFPGSELSPWHLEQTPIQQNPLSLDRNWIQWKVCDREYVQLKELWIGKDVIDGLPLYLSTFGIIQHRNFIDAMVSVDFYQETGDDEETKELRFLNRSEISKYELIPHKILGTIKPGAIVTYKKNTKNPIPIEPLKQVGMVYRVDHHGLVEAHFGEYKFENTKYRVNPFCLEVHKLPKDSSWIEIKEGPLPLPNPCSTEITEEYVSFIGKVANDLQEILDNPMDSIKIKGNGMLGSYSVMMSGLKGTPYEFGLFFFDLILPQDYPNSPPALTLSHLPEGDGFLSYSLTPEGEVLHPWLSNSEAGKGWDRTLSVRDLLVQIQHDVFPQEPLFSKPNFLFKENKTIADSKLLSEITMLNASVIITSVDFLLQNIYINPPEHWTKEILLHKSTTVPLMVTKFENWIKHPLGGCGDLCSCPKFHIYPISIGFMKSLTNRLNLILQIVESDKGSKEKD